MAATVAELIDWYRSRWGVEIQFDVIKNSCRVERSNWAPSSALDRALARIS
ncbi:transposase [Duganella sp. Dugasp56]|uniref:transposase n=1 Tax=Duganella sp. Dugasp56 TaxID=3243046 RepID=UPI0039B0DE3A